MIVAISLVPSFSYADDSIPPDHTVVVTDQDGVVVQSFTTQTRNWIINRHEVDVINAVYDRNKRVAGLLTKCHKDVAELTKPTKPSGNWPWIIAGTATALAGGFALGYYVAAK